MKNEAKLIEELMQGSQIAFKGIYDLYVGRLFSFALSYSKSREDTQEMVEDTFVWLWNNKEKIQEVDSLRPLLFLRMRHFLINAYRETLRSLEFRDYLDYRESLSIDNTDHVLEYDDFLKNLYKSLEQVTPTQRRVIEMARMDGIGIKEIASELNLTEQTVRNQLSLGLKKLRLVMKESYYLFVLLFFVN